MPSCQDRSPVPTRSQPNLILGVAEGMSWQAIEPFVVSLMRTRFEGDVLLFIADLERSTIRSLRSAGIDVVTMRRLQLPGRLLYPYHARLRRLHRIYPEIIRWASSLSRHPALTSARMAAPISVRDVRRFFLYYRHLSKHGQSYANVMLTDVRDVIFQSDPFDFDFGDHLHSFLEDPRKTLATEPHNRKWLQAAFGDEVLNDIGGCPIACAGVTIGPQELVLSYLGVMVEFLLKLTHQDTGLDQAVHNYVLHKGLVPQAHLIPNGAGAVATLGIVPDEDVNALLDAPVLHQYDRHPVLAKMLLQRLAETESRFREARGV
jgi:hypothetical protein